MNLMSRYPEGIMLEAVMQHLSKSIDRNAYETVFPISEMMASAIKYAGAKHADYIHGQEYTLPNYDFYFRVITYRESVKPICPQIRLRLKR